MVIVSIENGNCSLNGVSVANLKWKPRKVSAVRDFPPGCGPIVQTVNAVSQGAEASQNEATEPGTDHNVETKSLVNNGGGPNNAVVQVDDGKLLSFTNGTDNGGGNTKEGLTKKFPKRRVSAVRDFPPYCGLNAPEPSEEERIRINGRRKCEADDTGGGGNVRLIESNVRDSSNESPTAKQETEIIVVGEEAKVEFEDGKVEKLEHDVIAVGPRKKVHNIGQACQALVVYTRENIVKRKCSDDEVSEGEKIQDTKDKDVKNIVGQRVGYDRSVKKRLLNNDMRFSGDKICCVLGLKAPSFCAPGTLEKDIGSKAKGSQDSTTPTQKNEEKVVLRKSSSSGKVAYAGTYEMVVRDEEDDFVVDTEEQEERRLVLGLRAPLLCPPQIPASMTQKKSIKRKGKNQEKVVREELNSNRKVAYTGSLEMVVREEDFCVDTEGQEEILNSHEKHYLDVTLPPFGPRSSSDARNKVREILRLFQGLCRKILQGEEAKNNELTSAAPIKRVDLAAKAIIDKRGRALDVGQKTYGPVPGVEVGDEFQYRVELALVGIHRIFQGGIDYVKQGKDLIAVSVVASGGYDNEIDKPDCLIYSGAGGVAKDKSFENQKLERGNLALKNNINLKIPVRVIRGYKVKPAESSDSKSRLMTTYIYDGLYTVDDYKQEPGPHGNIVFKFELKRIPGQPELALREVKSKKFKTREGVCSNDIANGKEAFRISAINTIDDEKPPVFTYITRIMYPDWYRPFPPKGCDCVGRCSNKRCSCAFKNGGEIPYNHNGAIVEAKPLVYECGPSCRCPPSCYNRVTQHGMRIPLEIFKTESRGWGVRSLSSISSGSFICEYIGELLEDTEAEKRTGNDEYLFDIGQNYSDCSLTPDTKSGEIVGSGGFTIDAANYGNVGRFINHSCSPNLYAQNVLYDQEDKRMPHIMLFAAENIPPLQELTYHYNYTVDTVHDSDGNIKVKNCYCGSSECTGRLY